MLCMRMKMTWFVVEQYLSDDKDNNAINGAHCSPENSYHCGQPDIPTRLIYLCPLSAKKLHQLIVELLILFLDVLASLVSVAVSISK